MNALHIADSLHVDASSASFQRETDFRFARFLEWCPSLNGRRVALYGSGANAQRIMEADDRGFSIEAIVDDSAVGAQVAGCAAVDLQTALASGIDALVIAAEPKSVVAVSKRIYRQCEQAGAQLLDMYGNDLMALARWVEQSMRQPLAEQLAQVEASGILCVNVDLLLDAQSERTIPECMDAGLGMDRCIRFVIENALARGTRVLLYGTDAATDSTRVNAALARYGLADACEVVCPMAGLSLWPENGLYRFVLGEELGDRTLFVGSDLFRDCYIPLMYGARSIVTGCLKDPDFYQVAHCSEAETEGESWIEDARFNECGSAEKRLRACVASQRETLSECVGEPAARIASIVAPLVIGYTTWLASRLDGRGGEYDKVLFAARDGYVVYRVYELFRSLFEARGLPSALYFYTSRKASIGAAMESETLSDERRSMLEYFAKSGLAAGKAYAFVEFVGVGTCQRQLSKFAPFRIDGYYFGSRLVPEALHFLRAWVYFDSGDSSFLARYLALEPFLSSCEPSLACFSRGGVPVFADEHRSADELALLRSVHTGVEAIAREYFERYYEPGDIVGHGFVNAIMPYLDACDTDSMRLYDDLTDAVMSKRLAYEAPSGTQPAAPAADDGASRDGRLLGGEASRDKLLALLAAFDMVCQDFGLRYIATHGTLLGAVRNGGFVPGDDDLDVSMPREDTIGCSCSPTRGYSPSRSSCKRPRTTPHAFTADMRNCAMRRFRGVRPMARIAIPTRASGWTSCRSTIVRRKMKRCPSSGISFAYGSAPCMRKPMESIGCGGSTHTR